MKLQMDMDKEYGIVLEGGGAKGAYQIGVWKALREAGIKIKGIAGASVGALNGALICMDDLEKAEAIWQNIDYSKVMNVSEDLPLLKGISLSGISTPQKLKDIVEGAFRIVKDGGIDIEPLKKLISDAIDEDKIRNSPRELYAVTVSLDERKKEVIDVKTVPKGEMASALLASAYFPAFKNEKLDGKRYLDGGSLNNVPVDVLLDRDYKDILVIRIYGLGVDTEKFLTIPEDVNVLHIAPRQNLGGVLEFDPKRARKNMMLGYMDGQRFLYGLEGRSYYFDAPQTEAYYFDKMMSEMTLILHFMNSDLNEEEKESLKGYRPFTEDIFPKLAKKLKLKYDWNYKDLYLAILEEWAKELRMPRLQVYTPDQVVQKIHTKAGTLDSVLPV